MYFENIFIQINVISKHKFRKEFNLLVRVILGIFEENTLLEQVELNLKSIGTFGIPLQKLNLNLISPTPTPFSKQFISCFKLYYLQNILFFCLYQFLILDFKKDKKDFENHLYLSFSSYIFFNSKTTKLIYSIFNF